MPGAAVGTWPTMRVRGATIHVPCRVAPVMPHSYTPALRRRPRGGGLPDALLASLVLGLGVLAALRLPLLASRELGAAAQRQQAAHAAANLAAALHVQRGYGAEPPCMISACTLLPAAAASGDDCRARDCTPQRMAAQDLREWSALTQQLLPGAQAALRCRPARDGLAPAPALGPPQATAGSGLDSICTLRMRLAQGGLLRWRIRP